MKTAEFRQLTLEVEIKPTSTKVSREVGKRSVQFHTEHVQGKTEGYVLEKGGEFLRDIAFYLLIEVYDLKTKLPGAVEEFENKTTWEEIMAFLGQQCEANGPRDFLFRPLTTLVAEIGNPDKGD